MGIARDVGKIIGEYKRQCPYCKKLISREARVCPYCQRSVTPIPKAQPEMPTESEMKIGFIGAIIVGALMIAGLAYLMIKYG